MKTTRITIIAAVTFAFVLLLGVRANAQPSGCGVPPPPPPDGAHGTLGNKSPGTAPVGTADLLLIGLALAYAGTKVWRFQKELRVKN